MRTRTTGALLAAGGHGGAGTMFDDHVVALALDSLS